MKQMHLLMPMSGQGTRYKKAGYTDPKPLIPVSGVPMVERLMTNFPYQWPTVFVLAANHEETQLPDVLRRIRPQAQISYVPVHAQGPGLAALKGVESLPDDAPVLVSYCDYGLVWDAAAFERFVQDTDCDACVVSYRGFHAHYLSETMYAYCRMDGERVLEVKEKGCFTDNRENEFASCGAYYFKSAKLLKEAIEYQMSHEMMLNGEFYTSLTVQALIEMLPDAHVRVFEHPGFFQWGTPEDLQSFEYWEKSFRAQNRNQGLKRGQVEQVLIPMAGLGSRFQELFDMPKPFIPLQNTPMFRHAIESLPKAQKTVVVTLESYAKDVGDALVDLEHQVVSLKETPSGQALSTQAGVPALDPQKELIVSSCDHGIVLNSQTWANFHEDPQCDAAIFTMQGFPGAARTPQSYAYVVPEKSIEACPVVQSVSVKKTVSDTPQKDHVLVGSFWFKNAALMQEGIEELKEKDIRVNGELYLDSIFDLLMSKGYRVRMIPLEGYLCWGDPNALAETLYWQEVFGGYRLGIRSRFEGVATHA